MLTQIRQQKQSANLKIQGLPKPDTLRSGHKETYPSLALQRGLGTRTLQRLAVNQPGDLYEQEADRVAEQVMRMPVQSVGFQPIISEDKQVQRKCACEEDELRQKETGGAGEFAPPVVQQVLQSPGQPLDSATRAYFEPRFGMDFSRVRVHTDAKAAESAGAVNALAYTVGRDVVFRTGQYAPEAPLGKKLLAHELTHVVQQGSAVGAIPRLGLLDSTSIDGRGRKTEIQAASPVQACSPIATLQRQADIEQAPPDLSCDVLITGPGHLPGTDVFFSISSSSLTASQRTDIATFVTSWIADGSKDDVQVDGFASVDGPQALNWRLSCKRADAVRAELIAQGVPATKITTVAHGESTEFSTTALGPNRRAVITRQPSPEVPPETVPSDSFLSCEEAPPRPHGQPPPLDRWLENQTLNRIRAEAPRENRTLLSRTRGSHGEAVQLVQQALLSIGCDQRDENLLPRFGADGIFGAETKRAVEAFQEGRTTRDGIVGPLTLDELDKEVIPPAETRRGDPDAGAGKVAAPPSKSIQTHPLKARIKAIAMKLPKDIRVVRLAAKGGTAHQTLNRPFELTATIDLSPGPDLAGVRFGFFQLGRPFELWRVTYRDVAAKSGTSGADLNRDETFPLRSQLPALDHVSTFYPLPDGKQPAPVSASTTQVKVDFRDRPGNLFDAFFNDIPGRVFQLSGIFTQSFFFTALGLVTPRGQALLLQTFYWTIKNCEEIGANLFKMVPGPPIAIKGPFDCLKGDCRESEPGADKFGSSGGKPFDAIVKETLPTYGDGTATKPPAGPGDFKVPCAK